MPIETDVYKRQSLDEMKEVKIHGLGIERDLHFSPTALHEIAELEAVSYTHLGLHLSISYLSFYGKGGIMLKAFLSY